MKYISLFNILIPLALMTNAGAFTFSPPILTDEATYINKKTDDQGSFSFDVDQANQLPWNLNTPLAQELEKDIKLYIQRVPFTDKDNNTIEENIPFHEMPTEHDDKYISNRSRELITKGFKNSNFNSFWVNIMRADKNVFSKNGGVFIISAMPTGQSNKMSGYTYPVSAKGYGTVVIIYPTQHKNTDDIDSTIVHELTHVVFNDTLGNSFNNKSENEFKKKLTSDIRKLSTESLSLYSQVIFDKINKPKGKSYLPEKVKERVVPEGYSAYFALMTKTNGKKITYDKVKLDLLLEFLGKLAQKETGTTQQKNTLKEELKNILGVNNNHNLGEFEKAFSNSVTAQLSMQTSGIFNKGTAEADMLNAAAKERHTPRREKEIFSTQPQILEASLQRIGADIYTNFAD